MLLLPVFAHRYLRDRQIAQHAPEALLIGVVILPAREVADMTCAPKPGSPRLDGSSNLLIEADRKQDNLMSLLFFFQGLLDFIFDPIALDRMLGHDQQQLIA